MPTQAVHPKLATEAAASYRVAVAAFPPPPAFKVAVGIGKRVAHADGYILVSNKQQRATPWAPGETVGGAQPE